MQNQRKKQKKMKKIEKGLLIAGAGIGGLLTAAAWWFTKEFMNAMENEIKKDENKTTEREDSNT